MKQQSSRKQQEAAGISRFFESRAYRHGWGGFTGLLPLSSTLQIRLLSFGTGWGLGALLSPLSGWGVSRLPPSALRPFARSFSGPARTCSLRQFASRRRARDTICVPRVSHAAAAGSNSLASDREPERVSAGDQQAVGERPRCAAILASAPSASTAPLQLITCHVTSATSHRVARTSVSPRMQPLAAALLFSLLQPSASRRRHRSALADVPQPASVAAGHQSSSRSSNANAKYLPTSTPHRLRAERIRRSGEYSRTAQRLSPDRPRTLRRPAASTQHQRAANSGWPGFQNVVGRGSTSRPPRLQ